MPEERLLTTQEVAQRLGLHIDTVRDLLRRGELKGHLFGRRGGWRVRQVDLEAFIEKTWQQPQRPSKQE